MATPSSTNNAVEAAISRVLNAERAAHEDVERATHEAAAIVEDARATARAIAERTERRIRSVRAAFESRATREAAAIDAEALAQDAARELTPEDLARLERAVAALSDALTGDTRMKRSGDLEYACARIGARFGERPTEAAWRAIAVVRGFAAFLDAARTPPFRHWLSGITADAGPHAIEAALLGHWRALVDELRGWMPEQWHAAIAWAGALVELPFAQYLARGGAALPWMADDPVFGELSRNAAQAPAARRACTARGRMAES